MKHILVAFLLAAGLFLPGSAAAAEPQVWIHDSTYAAAAAETISVIPSFPLGKFASQGWSLKMVDTGGEDVLEASVTYYETNASTHIRGRTFTLTTDMEPKFPGRVDSLRIGFDVAHDEVRILFGAVNGEGAFPDWGFTDRRILGGLYSQILTVSTTSTDSIAGTTAKYHLPIAAFTVVASESLFVNWTDEDGDSCAAAIQINPHEPYEVENVDLYELSFSKHTANSMVWITKWAGGHERAQP